MRRWGIGKRALADIWFIGRAFGDPGGGATADDHQTPGVSCANIPRSVYDRYLSSYHFKDAYYVVHLKIAMLRALEQVGDTSSLSVVERLARRRGVGEWRKAIRNAAIQCLPALQLRAGELQKVEGLLRPVDYIHQDGRTLLRPTSGADENVASEELLRSVEESAPRQELEPALSVQERTIAGQPTPVEASVIASIEAPRAGIEKYNNQPVEIRQRVDGSED